jgi:hypothetical protein
MVKVAIVHEGNAGKSEDNWLIKSLIELLGLKLDFFQFYGVGGKSNFFKKDCAVYKRLLPLINTDQITRVLFVIDADCQANDQRYGGYDNTLNQWQLLVKDDLKIQDKVDLYISCDPCTGEGYVESLLFSTLDENKVECIQHFLDCSEFRAKNNHKAVLHSIYKIAYPNAPFDLTHQHFDELKQKLQALLA